MNNFEFKEIKNGELFDPISICSETPFTQAQFYGDWQKSLGREVKRFVVTNNNKIVAYFQIIKYPLILKKSYFYMPYGPVVANYSMELLNAIKVQLLDFVKKNNGVFARLDFTPTTNTTEQELLAKSFDKAPAYTYHSAYFQPRVEWFLYLNKTTDQIFDDMHKNTRYSIRFAEKNDVKSEIITTDFINYFSAFYELMLATAKRNGFHLHSEEYYKNIFKNLKSSYACLSVARFKDKILTVNLIIVYGGVANHVFGGSSDEYRNLMPSYLAQWEGIKHAKKIGCSSYNFGGISTGKIYKGWEGLTSFKKKFGGNEVQHSDFFDIVSKPFWYYLYNIRKFLKK